MGDAAGQEQLPVVLSGEFHRDVHPEGGGAFPYVHRHVQYVPAYHPDQFGLGVLSYLVMEAAHYAVGRAALVVLDKIHAPDLLLELPEVV